MQEEQHNRDSSLFQLNLDASNSYLLRSAATWAKVLGVVGILLGALFIIIAIIALSQAATEYDRRGAFADVFGTRGEAAGIGATFIILTGLIFILGAVFSLNFGNRIAAALKANDQSGLDRGFAALRNYYALRSIVLIIILLLFLISFAGSL